jgi:TPR repeat protein
MPLKDFLKRHKAEGQADVQPAYSGSGQQGGAAGGGYSASYGQQAEEKPDLPEFTFMRTTTSTQEIISPPSYPGDRSSQQQALNLNATAASPKRLSRFRRHSNASGERDDNVGEERTSRDEKRLSERLHFGHSRSASSSSVNIPSDLPAMGAVGQDEDTWEHRATLLAKSNPSASSTSRPSSSASHRRAPSIHEDDDIQLAISLHEAGDLQKSTEMFGRLGDPEGANNALSQVLYGLALRHGWGVPKDEAKAIVYLSAAASNSAGVEEEALKAGMKKGGQAKGELTLAIFELANCFRNGMSLFLFRCFGSRASWQAMEIQVTSL